MPAAYSTMRLTSDSGRKLRDRRRGPPRSNRSRTQSPRCRGRAPAQPRRNRCRNSGPRMISAPSSSACCVPCLAPCGRAGVVLDQKLDVGVLEFRQRHLGRVFHRLRRDARIACGRQRKHQTDLDLTGTDRLRLLRRARRERNRGELENWLSVCCMPEQAPSRGAPRIRPSAVRRVARRRLKV